MKLIQCPMTNSYWYNNTTTGNKPVGIIWHDTDGGNPYVKRYVQPYETDDNYDELIDILGKNTAGNDWNHNTNRQGGVHAFIGKLADESIATVQVGDLTAYPFGVGSGANGSCNGYVTEDGENRWTGKFWLQFEICDDGYRKKEPDKEYFLNVYREACEFTAYLCKMYGIDPNGTVEYAGMEVPTIMCHGDCKTYGLGSASRTDVYTWFEHFNVDMEDVRKDVTAILNGEKPEPEDEPEEEPEVEFGLLDKVRIKEGVTTFANGKKMSSWVPKSLLYVRVIKDNDTITVSTQTEGDTTGTVFASDLILVEKHKPEEEDGVEKEPVVEAVAAPEKAPEAVPETAEPAVEETVAEPAKEGALSVILKLLKQLIELIANLFTNK